MKHYYLGLTKHEFPENTVIKNRLSGAVEVSFEVGKEKHKYITTKPVTGYYTDAIGRVYSGIPGGHYYDTATKMTPCEDDILIDSSEKYEKYVCKSRTRQAIICFFALIVVGIGLTMSENIIGIFSKPEMYFTAFICAFLLILPIMQYSYYTGIIKLLNQRRIENAK